MGMMDYVPKIQSFFGFIHGSRFPKKIQGQSVCFKNVNESSKHLRGAYETYASLQETRPNFG